MKNSRLRKRVFYLCTALTLFVAGWYAHSWYHHMLAHKERRVTAAGYRFTSPLLDIELPEGVDISREPIPFKYKVVDLVKQISDKSGGQNISVYYRDLGDGPWFGINEHQEFNPASMMKVPVMIAWLKRCEKAPQAMKQTFLFDGAVDMSAFQAHKPRRTLEAGHRYPVEKLLEFMMSYSDNNATSLLYNNLKPEELNAVLDGMDVTNRPDGEKNNVTVHGYSGFFRILYNASFLNREMSEEALRLLSKQDFSQGISAGVPRGVVVASKFGEFEDGSPGGEKQLHEFGIVYHHKGAYILGVMTQGHDSARQAGIIRDISALVYSEVENSTMIGNQR